MIAQYIGGIWCDTPEGQLTAKKLRTDIITFVLVFACYVDDSQICNFWI